MEGEAQEKAWRGEEAWEVGGEHREPCITRLCHGEEGKRRR